MKKNLLIVLIVFLSLVNVSYACSRCSQGLTVTNGQKACQNVFSFLAIDFSFLSPRATAADVHVCSPKHGMPRCWIPKNSQCNPQCCPNNTQCCPCTPCYPCQPKCCPCSPQCDKQSMAPDDDKKEIPVCDKQSIGSDDKEEIPISNKQTTNTPCQNPQNKKSMFRLDLFRMFKIQIL